MTEKRAGIRTWCLFFDRTWMDSSEATYENMWVSAMSPHVAQVHMPVWLSSKITTTHSIPSHTHIYSIYKEPRDTKGHLGSPNDLNMHQTHACHSLLCDLDILIIMISLVLIIFILISLIHYPLCIYIIWSTIKMWCAGLFDRKTKSDAVQPKAEKTHWSLFM